MRIIVAGSRTATVEQVNSALQACPWIGFATAIVSGTARGADQFGEQWADRHALEIIRWPADWEKHGKRAGPLRNQTMALNAEGLVAVWDGASKGTASMIQLARRAGLRCFILRTDNERHDQYPAEGNVGDLWSRAEERAAIIEYSGGCSRREAEKRAGDEMRPAVR